MIRPYLIQIFVYYRKNMTVLREVHRLFKLSSDGTQYLFITEDLEHLSLIVNHERECSNVEVVTVNHFNVFDVWGLNMIVDEDGYQVGYEVNEHIIEIGKENNEISIRYIK